MWTFLSGVSSYLAVLLLNVQSLINLQPPVCRHMDLSVIHFSFVFLSLCFLLSDRAAIFERTLKLM